MMLKKYGVLPSEVDREDISAFFNAINYEDDDANLKIDQVGGW